MVEPRVKCPRCGSRVPESQVGPPEPAPPVRAPKPLVEWRPIVCAACEGKAAAKGAICAACGGTGRRGFVAERVG